MTWALVALGFSWLGDLVPSLVGDDAAFLVMVGFFLLAQVAYVVAFAPDVRRSVVHRRPVLLLPYAAVLVGLVAAVRARRRTPCWCRSPSTAACLDGDGGPRDRASAASPAIGGAVFLVSATA